MSGETDILVARRGALIQHEGRLHSITRGKTTVRAGHSILEDHGDLFEPLVVDFDLPKQQGKTAEAKQDKPAEPTQDKASSARGRSGTASGGDKDA